MGTQFKFVTSLSKLFFRGREAQVFPTRGAQMSRPAKLQMRLFLLSIAHSKIFCRRLRGKDIFRLTNGAIFRRTTGWETKGSTFFKKKRIRHNFTQSGWGREGRGGGGGLLVAASSVI